MVKPLVLRSLAPTNAVGVGDPPVSVRAVGRVVEQSDDAAAEAAVARAFPTLTEQERSAAIGSWRRDPEAAAPRPTWGQVLSLVPAIGGGALVLASGLAFLAAVLLAMIAEAASDRGGASLLTPGLLWGGGSLFIGAGLLLRAPWARRWVALLAVVAAVGSFLLAPRVALLIAPTGLGVALLLLPVCGRWFTAEGRAAAGALPLRPYAAAVGVLAVVGWVALAVVPRFREVFSSMGVTLPFGTRLLFDVSGFLRDWALVVPLLAALAPLPLLRLPARLERPAIQAVGVALLATVGSIGGWLFLPIWRLQQALGQ